MLNWQCEGQNILKVTLFAKTWHKKSQRKCIIYWKCLATHCQCAVIVLLLHFVINTLCHDFSPLCFVVKCNWSMKMTEIQAMYANLPCLNRQHNDFPDSLFLSMPAVREPKSPPLCLPTRNYQTLPSSWRNASSSTSPLISRSANATLKHTTKNMSK